MEFKLVTNKDNVVIPHGRFSEEEIREKESFGYTHIKYFNDSFFININDDYERERFEKQLGCEGFKWFQETTGNKQWVLYNPRHYKIDKNWEGRNILKLNSQEYDGSKLELPINASSVCGLFSWMKIPANLNLSPVFNLKDIVDTSLMFTGCIFPEDFKLTGHFNTKNTITMRYMFYRCTLPKGFTFPEVFTTENVTNMEYMFGETRIPDGIKLHDKFVTNNVQDMNHMFFNTEFFGTFEFGDQFEINKNIDVSCMFDGAKKKDISLEQKTFDEIKTILK